MGSVPAHMPTTIIVIERVAIPRSGASNAPTMPPVETMTALLPPESACATANTSALRLARRSSAATVEDSAIADMHEIPKRPTLVPACPSPRHCRRRGSELQCRGMPDDDRARLRRRVRADLPQRGLSFIRQQVDHMAGPFGT